MGLATRVHSRHPLDVASAVAALGEAFERVPPIDFAYLFGSQATGQAQPGSDLDVAVHVSVECSELERARLFWLLLSECTKVLDGSRLDLMVLNGAPVLLTHQVLRRGRLIFCRDNGARVRFVDNALRAYFSSARIRELHLRALRSRILKGEGIWSSRSSCASG